jgi:hypothetical protein
MSIQAELNVWINVDPTGVSRSSSGWERFRDASRSDTNTGGGLKGTSEAFGAGCLAWATALDTRANNKASARVAFLRLMKHIISQGSIPHDAREARLMNDNRDSPRILIEEFLEALSFVRFGYVDVSLGIGRNIVRAVELTGPVAAASKLAKNLQ